MKYCIIFQVHSNILKPFSPKFSSSVACLFWMYNDYVNWQAFKKELHQKNLVMCYELLALDSCGLETGFNGIGHWISLHHLNCGPKWSETILLLNYFSKPLVFHTLLIVCYLVPEF